MTEKVNRSDDPVQSNLSDREMSILRLLADGLTNVQIGTALHISKHTVAQHVAAMLGRTGSRTRAHLVAQAYECGLLSRNGQDRPNVWPLAAEPADSPVSYGSRPRSQPVQPA